MSLVTTFNSLMTHQVKLSKMTQDSFGNLVVASGFPVTESGFVEYGSKRVINAQGETVDGVALLFLKANTAFDTTHQQWRITDSKNSRVFTVAQSDRIDDPRTGATSHYEITLL